MRIHTFAGMLCALAFTAGATTVTFNFTTSGGTVGGGSPFGDTRTYTSGIYSVTATAYSLPGNLSGDFTAAQLNQYNGLGLAVCDQSEGAGCGAPEHQVDNHGNIDFVLFTFYVSGVLTSLDPASIVINPYGVYDRDMTYWVGNTGPALSTIGLAGVFGSRIDDDSTVSGDARTVTLDGGTGDALLIAARLPGDNADGYLDYFKIESLTINTVATPEPATFGLSGLALIGLGLLRRRAS